MLGPVVVVSVLVTQPVRVLTGTDGTGALPLCWPRLASTDALNLSAICLTDDFWTDIVVVDVCTVVVL